MRTHLFLILLILNPFTAFLNSGIRSGIENISNNNSINQSSKNLNNVVEIWLKKPNWISSIDPNAYQGVYDFHYDIDMARKIDPNEDRAVKAVKFDIIFLDVFKEEISRWEGINFELPQPLGRYDYVYENKGYSITYDSREKRALPLEIGRQMHESSGITIKADIKAILFTNGDILK